MNPKTQTNPKGAGRSKIEKTKHVRINKTSIVISKNICEKIRFLKKREKIKSYDILLDLLMDRYTKES